MSSVMRRTYDHDFKVEAVRLMREEGRSVAEVSHELGVPRSTLRGWKQRLGRPSRADRNQEEARMEEGRPPQPRRVDRLKDWAPPPIEEGRPSHSSDSLRIPDIFSALRRRWWLVALASVLGVVAAMAMIMREIPQYRATVVLRLGGFREAVTAGIESPMQWTDRFSNPLLSQIQLLRSRSLIGEVVDSVGFRLVPDYRGFYPGLLTSVQVTDEASADSLWFEFGDSSYSVSTQRENRTVAYGDLVDIEGVSFIIVEQPSTRKSLWTISSQQVAIDRVLANLRVAPRTETNVVDVSFLHPNPAVAQQTVNTLVTRHQDFEVRFAQERSYRRRVFLEEQLAQTDTSLAAAQRALSQFQTRAQTYDARQELTAQRQNRFALDIRREELDAERRMLQSQLDKLDQPSDEVDQWEVLRTLVSSPGIAENAIVSSIHQQLLRHRLVLDSLTTGEFGSAGSSPDVRRQRQLIAATEEELTSAIRSHVASLDARSVALTELTERVQSELAALPTQLVEEARLAQIVDTYQKMSDQLREDYQKARMAEGVAEGQADIIDLADVPYTPESAMRTVKLGLGFLVGLLFGGGGAMFLDQRTQSIRRREEIEDIFNLPLLGVIPRATVPDVRTMRRPRKIIDSFKQRRMFLRRSSTAAISQAPVEYGNGTSLRMVEHATHAGEAYRKLRTNLLFTQWTDDVRTVLITSTAPREGKTLTAASLAVCIAEEGRRVLLVDGDLWRGRIHKMVGIPPAPGLADLLSGENSGKNTIRKTGVPGLHFMPRGTRHPNPSSLTRGKRLQSLLDHLREDFDVIIIDAPPVLAAATTPVLATVADGVLLLVRAGEVDRRSINDALKELKTVGARLLGVVFNDPTNSDFSSERRRYYYEYAGDE